jgi:hypothetical protein
VSDARLEPCARCGTPLEAGDLRCAICGQSAPAAAARAPDRAAAAVLRCEQCGAAVAYSPEAQGAKCAFCAAVLRLEQPEDPIEAAEVMLPFRVDASTAQAALRAWMRSLGFFRPSDLASASSVEALRPLFWAAWIFDARAIVTWTADSDAGGGHSAWAPHAGVTPMEFAAVLVPATRGLRRDECLRLAPFFHLSTATAVAELQSGALLERFDVQRSAARAIVADAVHATAVDRLQRGAIPGSRFRNVHASVLLNGLVTRRVAMPTYVLAYRYRGRPYRAVVHGQDARCIVAAAPYSVAKIVLVVLGVALLLAAVVAVVAWRAAA